jgi:hypothetical protein
MRHLISGYIWRLRFEWPLPLSPERELTDSTNASIESNNEQWQTIFDPPEIPVTNTPDEPKVLAPRRILKTKTRRNFE